MSLQKFWIGHLLYPAMEQFRGNQTRAFLTQLKGSQFSPNLPAIQRRALTELLLCCARHVPAYRALNLPPDEIRADPIAVLHRCIPPLRKIDFQTHPERYLSDAVAPDARIENCTGGSTGEPTRFYMTRAQVERYEAARWRGLSWYGITPGSRSVMLWGNPVELSTQRQRRQRLREGLLKNRRVLSAYALGEERLMHDLARLRRYRPAYLYGYATALAALARLLEQSGQTLRLPLRAVVSTSETLAEEQARRFSRLFSCPVVNEYGARDAGILAYSCPHGQLHLTAENCLVEVLDPVRLTPLPAGQTGVLAVTDLYSRAQPRLRYLLGDVGRLSDERCPCGRTLPVLAALEGREDALLVIQGGTLVHGNLIGQLLRPLPGIQSFQFRQHTPSSATLLIVPLPGAAPDLPGMTKLLSHHLPGIAIHTETVAHIAPSPSGKVRYSIREFPLETEKV